MNKTCECKVTEFLCLYDARGFKPSTGHNPVNAHRHLASSTIYKQLKTLEAK